MGHRYWLNLCRNWRRYFLLMVFLFVAIYPLVSIGLAAFKTEAELAGDPFALPAEWHFDNFTRLWERGAFGDYFHNSVVIIIPVVLGSVILSVLSGYAFGRFHFWGSRVLSYMFLLGILMPYQAMVIPLYYNLRAIGLIDTYGALILPLIGLSVPFGTLWMWGFFREVPQELIDASVIDGCTTWSALWHVLLPLAGPAMLALAALLFVWNWNEFLLALVLLPTNFTLPVGLAMFQGRYLAEVPVVSAGATVTMVPSLIVYIILQRHFIRGITAGVIQR